MKVIDSVVALILVVSSCESFTPVCWEKALRNLRHVAKIQRQCGVKISRCYAAKQSSPIIIDLQADVTKYGRGEMHLSAVLEEGDVVVYQIGTWLVDGVEVGDGSPPRYVYAVVETMQVVWTHNCEHGVIRGFELKKIREPSQNNVDNSNMVKLSCSSWNPIEFGPEQLIARIPVSWDDNTNHDVCTPLVTLDDEKWKN